MIASQARQQVTINDPDAIQSVAECPIWRLRDGRLAAEYDGLLFPIAPDTSIDIVGEWAYAAEGTAVAASAWEAASRPRWRCEERPDGCSILVNGGGQIVQLITRAMMDAGHGKLADGPALHDLGGDAAYERVVRVTARPDEAEAILRAIPPSDWQDAQALDSLDPAIRARDHLFDMFLTARRDQLRAEADAADLARQVARLEAQVGSQPERSSKLVDTLHEQIADLRAQLASAEREALHLLDERDRIEAELPEVGPSDERQTADMDAAPDAPLSGRHRQRAADIAAWVRVTMPGIRLMRDSAEVIARKYSDLGPLLDLLRALDERPESLANQSKRFRSADCLELHVRTGMAADGRLYYRRSTAKLYHVLVSMKQSQGRDAHWLRANFNDGDHG